MNLFHGLEVAKQALSAQQSALHTTSHNIANANTEGYSRQRVNLETASPFPPASRNRPEVAGQKGTGVEAESVERIRHQFLDQQYRTDNSSSGYWRQKADTLERVEGVMNEPSDTGLAAVFDQFRDSLADLSANPEDSGARSVVARRGKRVAETFNYLSDSLGTIRTDLDTQIAEQIDDVNDLLRQIDAINDQVQNIEVGGQLANDLYDERDRLIDDLSEIVDIQVTYDKSSDSAPGKADGVATINLVTEEGSEKVLVEGRSKTENSGYHELSMDANNEELVLDDTAVSLQVGSLQGLIDAQAYVESDMLGRLDHLAGAFADVFNGIHRQGEDLTGDDEEIRNLFQNADTDQKDEITADNIAINGAIVADPDLLAAADENGGAGNGGNAQALADAFDTPFREFDTSIAEDFSRDSSINGFYEAIIGDMGVTAEEANDMAENTEALRSQVEEQRMSVSSVSLDEEMAHMIEFQHAYNAAARSMTAVDEMLDNVINNMGLVGR